MRAAVKRGVGAAGVLATALGVLAVVAPTAVTDAPGLSTVAEVVADVGVRSVVLAGCGVVVLYLLRAAGRSPDVRTVGGDRDAAAQFDRLLDHPPERVTANVETTTAGAFDARIDHAVAGDDRALNAVRERLADATVSVLGRATDWTPQSAERAVAAGTWTNDPVAGAFLAGAEGPEFSLSARIRHWLDPEAERRRRIARTVRAIEASAGGGVPRGVAQSATGGPTAGPERQRPPTGDAAAGREPATGDRSAPGPEPPGPASDSAAPRAPDGGQPEPSTSGNDEPNGPPRDSDGPDEPSGNRDGADRDGAGSRGSEHG